MPLSRSLVAALASSASRRRPTHGRIDMTAIGKTWRAALVSDQRGCVLSRKGVTRADAFAQAHALRDAAEDRTWFNGKVVGVRVEQHAGG
jgi:hypothetical protein